MCLSREEALLRVWWPWLSVLFDKWRALKAKQRTHVGRADRWATQMIRGLFKQVTDGIIWRLSLRGLKFPRGESNLPVTVAAGVDLGSFEPQISRTSVCSVCFTVAQNHRRKCRTETSYPVKHSLLSWPWLFTPMCTIYSLPCWDSPKSHLVPTLGSKSWIVWVTSRPEGTSLVLETYKLKRQATCPPLCSYIHLHVPNIWWWKKKRFNAKHIWQIQNGRHIVVTNQL